MEKYDYRRAMVKDIKDYITNNPNLWADPMNEDDITNYWYDLLWSEDLITGNGAYYYDTEDKCSEYVCHNFDLLYEAAREFCIDDDINVLIKHYENKSLARYFDATIRCYLLGECIEKALEELNS